MSTGGVFGVASIFGCMVKCSTHGHFETNLIFSLKSHQNHIFFKQIFNLEGGGGPKFHKEIYRDFNFQVE